MSRLNVGTVNTSLGVKLPLFSSSNKPSSPEVGLMIFNTSKNLVEFWDGGIWSNFESGVVNASGGTITDLYGYRIHTFLNSGTFTVTEASQNAKVEYLIVGGGGAGGGGLGGGGGAGGFLTGTTFVTPQDYSIVGGSGGLGDNKDASLYGGGSGGQDSSAL